MGLVYKMYLGRYTPAWHELGIEEQRLRVAEVQAALHAVGGRTVLSCTADWSQDAWQWFGVEVFPSLEAAQQYQAQLDSLRWKRLTVEIEVFGTEMTANPAAVERAGTPS